MEVEKSLSKRAENNIETKEDLGDDTEINKKRPSHWKYKIFCIYIGLTILGFAGSVRGPALVDLEELYGVTTKEFSVTFIITGLGFLLGGALCGVLYERFNYELQFTLALCIMGVSLAAAPWVPILAGFIAVSALESMCRGFIISAGQAYVLHVMKERQYKEPVLQGIHAVYCLGSAVGPFVIQPFLVERNNNNTKNSNFTNATRSQEATDTAAFAASNVTKGDDQLFQPSKVQFGYLLCGCITTFTSLFYMLLFCIGDRSCVRTKPQKEEKEKLDYRATFKFYLACLGLLIFWFAFEVWVEASNSTYVATFAIKELGWSKDMGAWVTSVLWAGQFAGRLASVPIAAFLAPRTMVYISVTGTVAAMAIMLALVKVNDVFYWIACALAGLAESSAFGTMVLWASQCITITGPAASVFIIGGGTGGILGPLVAGQLLEQYSPMILVYLAFGVSVLQVIYTLGFEILTRFYGRMNQDTKRKNTNGVDIENTKKHME